MIIRLIDVQINSKVANCGKTLNEKRRRMKYTPEKVSSIVACMRDKYGFLL